MRIFRGSAAMLLLAFAVLQTAFTQDKSDETALAGLIREAARETAAKAAPGETELRVLPEEIHPMPRQIFAEELAARNIAARGQSPNTAARITVDVREMNSSTDPLGKSSYLRTVSLSLGVMIEDRVTGAVAWSKSFDLQHADTLSGSPEYEYRDFRNTEPDTWVDSVLLPVLTAGAALVVVVLLFTVRGS